MDCVLSVITSKGFLSVQRTKLLEKLWVQFHQRKIIITIFSILNLIFASYPSCCKLRWHRWAERWSEQMPQFSDFQKQMFTWKIVHRFKLKLPCRKKVRNLQWCLRGEMSRCWNKKIKHAFFLSVHLFSYS